MYVVTGASGLLGRAVVHSLARLVLPSSIVATMRDPSKGADLLALGVEVRHGDYADAASLTAAFRGATQVLLVSSNARGAAGDPIAQHRNALEAAQAVGARRLVYTSQMSSAATSAFPPARDHATTEAMLAASGMAWTALRNGFYASSGLQFMGEALRTAELRAPHDGKTAWTAHADLADGAAAILANEGSFDGPTPPLTGHEALDLGELAGIAGATLDIAPQRQLVSDDDFKRAMLDRHLPDSVVELMLGYYIASRNGEFAATAPTLEQLIGRKPMGMSQIIAEHVANAAVAR